MPSFLPFHAVRYNLAHVGSLSDVVTDTSAPDDLLVDRLYKRHPANIVRMIANRVEPGDDPDDRFERVGDFVQQWISEGVLVRDESPSFYHYRQTFGADDCVTGWIGLTSLFSQGEPPTTEGTTASRWIEASGMFSIAATGFCDGLDARLLAKLQANVDLQEQAFAHDAVRFNISGSDISHQHELTRFGDPAAVAEISEMLSVCTLTIPHDCPVLSLARAYRDRVAATHGRLPPTHPANFLMTLLVEEAGFRRYFQATRRRLTLPPGLLLYGVQ